jgi:hypothetical protein
VIFSLDTTATYDSLILEYLPELRKRLLYPLFQKNKSAEDAIAEVIEFMDSYAIIPEERLNILQLTDFADSKFKSEDVPKEIKAQLTRTFNDKNREQVPMKVPRANIAAMRVRGGKGATAVDEDDEAYIPGITDADDLVVGEEEGEAEDEEGDDLAAIKKDKMLKQIAPPKEKSGKGASPNTSKSKSKAAAPSKKNASKAKSKAKKKKSSSDSDDSDEDY